MTVSNQASVAIFKASYNVFGDTAPKGGICGTGFFIKEGIVLTTYHSFSRNKFKPNPGYNHCRFWLVSRGCAIPIERAHISDYPEFDAAVIKLTGKQRVSRVVGLSDTGPTKGEGCFSVGYFSSEGTFPELNAALDWSPDGLIITQINLSNQVIRGNGVVEEVFIERNNYDDIKLKGKEVVRLSYGGRKGMSGGPLIRASTGEAIGMMSYGQPPENTEKEILFAISARELKKLVNSI